MACQRSKSQNVRAATLNVSSMLDRSGEVVDALHRRKIDFCCAQETRWKGESARMLGANGRRYKIFWQRCNKGTAGVGVFIAEKWIDSVVDVVGVNEWIMYVKLVIGKHIVNIVSAYAQQVDLSAEEKDDWDSLHQTDTACSWLVCHSRGDCSGEHCANCIHLPRLSGGPAAQFFGEPSRASPQHGWRSAYSLRETLSPTQDQNQH